MSTGDGRVADSLLVQRSSVHLSYGIKRGRSRKVRHFSEVGMERSLTQAGLEWKNFYQGSAKYKSLIETHWVRRFRKRTVVS